MNCWNCDTQLIWNADHDLEDHEDYVIVTHLTCPNCDSFVEVYLPEKKEKVE